VKKIALAVNEFGLLDHFGHCDHFVVYETENNQVLRETVLTNPEHRPGFLPKFLYDQGVSTVIASNLGQMAVKVFNGFGVEVVYGVSGEAKEVTERYLSGELVSSEVPCTEHHSHEGGHHHHH